MPESEPDGRRAALETQREALTTAMWSPDTPASALAGLSKELRAVWAELVSLGAAVVEEDDVVVRIERARAARDAAPTDPPSAARRSQPRKSNGSHRVHGGAG